MDIATPVRSQEACPRCRLAVNGNAKSCPHCGERLSSTGRFAIYAGACGLLALIAFALVMFLAMQKSEAKAAAESAGEAGHAVEQPAPLVKVPPLDR